MVFFTLIKKIKEKHIKKFFLTLLFIVGIFSFHIPQSLAFAESGNAVIQLNVFFCNVDLTCDPEENYVSCPSDCPLPPPATTTPTSTPSSTTPTNPGNTGGTTSGGSSYVFNPFTTPLNQTPSPYSASFYTKNLFDAPLLIWDIRNLNNGSIYGLYNKPTVRILRSTSAFPYAPDAGGLLVYEGDATTVYDKDAPKNSFLYYTLFIKNSDGSETQVGTTNFSWPIFATYAPSNYFELLVNNIDQKNENNFFDGFSYSGPELNMCKVTPELPGDYLNQKQTQKYLQKEPIAALALFAQQIFLSNIFLITLLIPFIVLVYVLSRMFFKEENPTILDDY